MSRATPRTWREGRRLRAWTLKQRGWSSAEIAEALGVTKAAVGQWAKAAKEGGLDALARRPRKGQGERVSPGALADLPAQLDRGPEHHGFTGAYWSCSRVAVVIERMFGVRYSSRHVGRLLKRLNWWFHKPQMRAVQRDEAAIESWLSNRWPALRDRSEKGGPDDRLLGGQANQRGTLAGTDPLQLPERL